MAGLNDVIREAFPDGNVAKSLTDALGALLGSNVLTGGGAGRTASTGSQPTTDAGGVLGGLGGLLNKLEQSGLGLTGPTPKMEGPYKQPPAFC